MTPNIIKDGKDHEEENCPKKEFDSMALSPIQSFLKCIKKP
jgi:hypothetical protein